MKFLVFGSMNIDKVYKLPALPEKGETLTCTGYEVHVGGKGLNQAVSLARAGAEVYMAGRVGADGRELVEFLQDAGVNTDLVQISDTVTGHAVIEVDGGGQNQMILFPGANHEITPEYCDRVLRDFGSGDVILMEYETSCVEYMIEKAAEKGLIVAINPSPFTEAVKDLPYGKIDIVIVNEYEGRSIAETDDNGKAVKIIRQMTEGGAVIMTLGADGAIYSDSDTTVKVPAFKVKAADTTGAGDTFAGYFLKAYMDDADEKEALRRASAASALVVQKVGAAQTIPAAAEVDEFLKKHS